MIMPKHGKNPVKLLLLLTVIFVLINTPQFSRQSAKAYNDSVTGLPTVQFIPYDIESTPPLGTDIYVAFYSKNVVSVIDDSPWSGTYRHMIVNISIPSPGPIQSDGLGGHMYVGSQIADRYSISVINTKSHQIEHTISVPGVVTDLAYNSRTGNQIYALVSLYNGLVHNKDVILVIDTGTNNIIRTF